MMGIRKMKKEEKSDLISAVGIQSINKSKSRMTIFYHRHPRFFSHYEASDTLGATTFEVNL
jgi:hypothetical protein